jgi:outer membrane protein
MTHLHRLRSAFGVLIAVAVLLLAPSALAEMKFAVVDVQRAVMDTEDGLRAQATLKKLFDKRQRELDARQERLQREREDIEKQSRVLSRDALQRRTEEWQRSMTELQGVFVEFNKELQKKQSELTQPVLNKVLSILRQVASTDGYDGIFERNAVPYFRSDLDITDKVIQLYNTTGRSVLPPDAAPLPDRPAGSAPAPAARPAPSPSVPRPTGTH